MKREPLTHRLWVKIAAYLLLSVSASVLILSSLALGWNLSMNAYTVDLTELKRQMFVSACRRAGEQLLYTYLMVGEDNRALPEEGNRNIVLALSDSSGQTLWSGEDSGALSGFPYVYQLNYRTQQFEPGDFIVDYMGTGSHLIGNTEGTAVSEEETRGWRYYTVSAAVRGELVSPDAPYWENTLSELAYSLRYQGLVLALASLLLLCLSFVFLMRAAGHRAGREELVPGPLTAVPFDLFTASTAALLMLPLGGIAELLGDPWGAWEGVSYALAVLLAVLCALMLTGWCASFALRVKLGTWWRNTLAVRLCRLCRRALCGAVRVGRELASALLGALPLFWRTAVVFLCLTCGEYLMLMLLHWNGGALTLYFLLARLVCFVLLLRLVLILQRLQRGAQALAAGELDYRTDTCGLRWEFRKHAENLNSIAQGMRRAVEEQLKSERLKTELITNVSHDIKTPLTSILNYVDLLRRDHSPEQEREYLEVLERQSRKLKKMTEDLVELSKATTGNLTVSLARHSLSELLCQALGEYGDRLAAAGLETVFTPPAQDIFARVDGTLLWRVLDNLFSNVCKYAMPGTRFYVELTRAGGRARLLFKNISRAALNLSPEELMERFVRGASDRGGEGSGLGLGIARSLTELQGGEFLLTVDGDLFKVELRVPECA